MAEARSSALVGRQFSVYIYIYIYEERERVFLADGSAISLLFMTLERAFICP